MHPEQRKALRRMTPARRLEVGLQFIEEMRQLRKAAIRAWHPDWTEAQIENALREFIRRGHS